MTARATATRRGRIERALWFIESHHAEPITLNQIAEICALSRWEMSRAFHGEMGMSFSAYLRGRRLTEAARNLAAGTSDIFDVALEAGYGSREAFARAFRSRFGLTPGEVRARQSVEGLDLVRPVRRQCPSPVLKEPAIRAVRPLSIAGISGRLPAGGHAGIPALWQRLHQKMGFIADQVGEQGYGICSGGADGGYDYLAGVEVADLSELPAGMTAIRLPAGRYAVFGHRGHVTDLAILAETIFTRWLPGSGHSVAGFPDLVERYDRAFDPWTGWGRVEIWVPLASPP
ncbi:AraC family transcriptional regulator [Inquilinus sp. CAU 1745]|uniref:AraC family transcriptional regulator n=1 Tax=Inquilinus sp. CAU 1745 TaxID=3140369 RepID=UPI00325B09D2